jgi:hypothetical protein
MTIIEENIPNRRSKLNPWSATVDVTTLSPVDESAFLLPVTLLLDAPAKTSASVCFGLFDAKNADIIRHFSESESPLVSCLPKPYN